MTRPTCKAATRTAGQASQVRQEDPGKFEVPDWDDRHRLEKVRDAHQRSGGDPRPTCQGACLARSRSSTRSSHLLGARPPAGAATPKEAAVYRERRAEAQRWQDALRPHREETSRSTVSGRLPSTTRMGTWRRTTQNVYSLQQRDGEEKTRREHHNHFGGGSRRRQQSADHARAGAMSCGCISRSRKSSTVPGTSRRPSRAK